jgi:hypothetical protein
MNILPAAGYISPPLKPFTICIFVQFPIATLMFRLNANVQIVTEAMKSRRQPTIKQHELFT